MCLLRNRGLHKLCASQSYGIADPSADDSSTGRGVVLGRAATKLRSIETQPLTGGSTSRRLVDSSSAWYSSFSTDMGGGILAFTLPSKMKEIYKCVQSRFPRLWGFSSQRLGEVPVKRGWWHWFRISLVILEYTVESFKPETWRAPVKVWCTLCSAAYLLWKQSRSCTVDYPLWRSPSHRLECFLWSGDGHASSKTHLWHLKLVTSVWQPLNTLCTSFGKHEIMQMHVHCGAHQARDLESSWEVWLTIWSQVWVLKWSQAQNLLPHEWTLWGSPSLRLGEFLSSATYVSKTTVLALLWNHSSDRLEKFLWSCECSLHELKRLWTLLTFITKITTCCGNLQAKDLTKFLRSRSCFAGIFTAWVWKRLWKFKGRRTSNIARYRACLVTCMVQVCIYFEAVGEVIYILSLGEFRGFGNHLPFPRDFKAQRR